MNNTETDPRSEKRCKVNEDFCLAPEGHTFRTHLDDQNGSCMSLMNDIILNVIK